MPNSPNNPIHLEGKLLLADPTLHDGIFRKSVIFLTEHNSEDGAYGLIINQPTEQTVGDLLAKNEFEPLRNIPVYIGGPIDQEHLTFAAFSTTKGQPLQLKTRISAKDAIQRAQQPGALVRAFAGHARWSSGQLEGEIRKNSWITTLPDNSLLSNEHKKTLWAQLLRNISPYHKILAETPNDIFVN